MRSKTSFIDKPVVVGEFDPTFYWTGDLFVDALSINKPHVKKEGAREDRTLETYMILKDLQDYHRFEIIDLLNIQNILLKKNNWRGIRPGFRYHEVNLSNVKHNDVAYYINLLFPIKVMQKEELLEWYRQCLLIHPLSDLNGRTFGIIIASLYNRYLKKIQ